MKKKAWIAVTLLIALVLLVSLALADTTVYVDPESTDIQQEAAVELAKETICDHFENTESLLEASTAAASFGYLDADVDEPLWMIEFTNSDANIGSYFVEIDRVGEILCYNAPYEKPFRAGEDEMTGVTFAEPGEYDVTEQDAIFNAKAALNEIGDYETRMDHLTSKAYFLYGDRFNNGYEPVWLIYFYQGGDLQQKMLLGYDGSYIQTVAADKQFSQTNRTYQSFSYVFDYRFDSMTYEEKAVFSEQWIPIVDAYIQENPYFPDRKFRMFYQATRQVFGLPSEGQITQQEATAIAQQAIVVLGESEQTLNQRKIGYSFDVTNPDRPLWVLVMYRPITDDTTATADDFHVYEVKINATTGEVVKTILYVDENSFDGYYF